MAKARSPNREKALQIWLEHKGEISNRALADLLGEKEKTISNWKSRDQWNVVLQTGECSTTIRTKSKAGAPKGNKNAVGNSGGAAPKGNSNAVIHGFFRKFFPDETLEIMEQIEARSPLDMLWDNIVIQYTAIIRAQRIMFVQDQGDMTKEIRKTKTMSTEDMEMEEQEWEIQFAWDKQANFLQAQSRAMATLQSLIRQYEDMCNKGLATEEQRLRVEKLKLEVTKLQGSENTQTSEDWVSSLEEVAARRRAKRDQQHE